MASPTESKAWQALQQQSETFRAPGFRLDSLFQQSGNRFSDYSLRLHDLLLDYSKNYLDGSTLAMLLQLASDQKLPEAIAAMFAGEAINNTEQRPALHVALREPADVQRFPEVSQTLQRMTAFTEAVHKGNWRGHSGRQITDVVNIGIGGSDLGPAMVTEALRGYHQEALRVHFVSNVDPSHLQDTLARLSPETTLFIIASKSFTTLETHQNAAAARRWFLQSADESAIARHFVAITTNLEAAREFGLAPDNLFPMWDWVGGRYSLWSAIGLPIALAVGMERFRELLAGAHAMDTHFRESRLEANLPVIMGLLTVWYTGFFEAHSSALVPYSQRLAQLPAYMQQLYMESLGKRVRKQGDECQTNTGEVLWGTAGTNGQHSYFQLLHQGREFIPVDFIAFARSEYPGEQEAHQHLLANCLSQSLALMTGKPGETDPHRQVPGNHPSNTLILSRLDPFNLGMLIALYEHKVFVQSVIWDINAFDQWGVELGKLLSKSLFTSFDDETEAASLDASSLGLLEQLQRWKET